MQTRVSLIFALICILSCPATASATETITLSTGDWPPYFSEEFEHNGLGALLCSEAFRLAGIHVKLSFMPWKRAYQEALNNKHDGTAAWRSSPERKELFHVSDPVFRDNNVFFYRKSLPFDWQELDDVGHLTVGVTLGYIQEKMLAPVVRQGGGTLDTAPTDTANLQKLVRGRIDVFPCSRKVGRYLLQTKFRPEGAAKVGVHPHPLMTNSLHLLIPRTHHRGRELINKFNQGLARLRESGLYERYIEQSAKGEYLPPYQPAEALR